MADANGTAQLVRARAKKVSEVSADLIRHLFDYQPETGLFFWKNPRGKARTGQLAGSTRADGYVQLSVKGFLMFAHRAAWLYVHGELSDSMVVDHINQNTSDNRISNLRLADRAENGWNNRRKGGIRGVQRNSKGTFTALIRHRGKRHYLGSYATVEGAAAAFNAAAAAMRGEFDATGKVKPMPEDESDSAEVAAFFAASMGQGRARR